MERDGGIGHVAIATGISTHTLTWSVTITHKYLHPNSYISTHTLTWSVTCKRIDLDTDRTHFNSHAHVERDYTFAAV